MTATIIDVDTNTNTMNKTNNNTMIRTNTKSINTTVTNTKSQDTVDNICNTNDSTNTEIKTKTKIDNTITDDPFYISFLKNLFQYTLTDSNNNFLDPLSSIIRLHTLRFRRPNTKLTFSPFSISFDPPTQSQAIVRKWKMFIGLKSNRRNITLLRKIIEYFISKYNLRHEQLRFFALGSLKGLNMLRTCYMDKLDEPITYCIDYFITIIREALEKSGDEIRNDNIYVDDRGDNNKFDDKFNNRHFNDKDVENKGIEDVENKDVEVENKDMDEEDVEDKNMRDVKDTKEDDDIVDDNEYETAKDEKKYKSELKSTRTKEPVI